jgi:hypothetical protein
MNIYIRANGDGIGCRRVSATDSMRATNGGVCDCKC